jgi:TonB-linked SusC/RagA family outer membrane protein
MNRSNRVENLPAKKILLLSAVFALFPFFGSYGQLKITGIITGTGGLPLPGATIEDKTNHAAALSDSTGVFTIDANTGHVLFISYIGYKTSEIKIINREILRISLSESLTVLEKVLVVGYTSQKAKAITGSVAVVSPDDLTAMPAGQAEQMLQGRVAGLNIITSGMPGGSSNVRLHGIGNFGDVTPLYIIDGIQGNINNLNPNDIESLQVLKDAGAYAIFGVRGANGVIIITTRNGKNGKTKIDYDFYIGTTRPLHKGPDLLNPQEMADLTWLALKNSGQVAANGNPIDRYYGNGLTAVLPDYLIAGPYHGLFEGDPRVNPDLYNIDFTAGDLYQIIPSNKTGTDWFHEAFKPAISQNHSITVSGANDKNKYLFSLGYLDQQGTLLNTYLKRFTARINTTFSVNDKIRIGENLQLSYSDNPRIATQQGPNDNEIFGTFTSQTILPVYDIKGGWSTLQDDGVILRDNIVARRVITKDNKTNYWDLFGNAWA